MSRIRKVKSGTDTGFTLIELLVVVAIIAVLASLLMPSLQNAKERGKQALCLSNMKQIHLALMMYADDNDGWFPPVDYLTANIFNALAMSGDLGAGSGWCWDANPTRPTWMPRYFPNMNLLHCPAMDPNIITSYPATGHWYYDYPKYKCYWASYRILAATSEWPGGYAPWVFYGWGLQAHGSTASGIKRVPCPNIKFVGQSVSGYGSGGDQWGPLYIPPASEEPAVLDLFDPSGKWNDIGGFHSGVPLHPYLLNNHSRLNGENIVFVDGHGEWRTASAVTNRFAPNWAAGPFIWW